MVKRIEYLSGHRLKYELSNGHLICACMTLSYKLTQNLLAMNVLGLFNQYIEVDTSSIFFKPHNAAVDFRLIAGGVFVQGGDDESGIKQV